MRGEYAGVEGAESMNVPKLLADIGGDIGPGDIGLVKPDVLDGDDNPKGGKRWGDSGDIARGGFGMPCVERGLLATVEAPGTARVAMIMHLIGSALGKSF